ncbi:MAG: hemerythrin domain-containing protein [Acidobacteriaceae bacterium]|nr:hemerythrin domain-containing protein [Acidobacteriaceae bacterium]
MLRDKNLIPLSHQHQHALALCVRLDRAIQAKDVDVQAWQAEIRTLFEQEIAVHFAAEEKVVFPSAARFEELAVLVKELQSEHAALRELFLRAASGELGEKDLATIGETLSHHIRKEERQMFEGLQKLMSSEELSRLGTELKQHLKDAAESCLLPNEATRLRPRS